VYLVGFTTEIVTTCIWRKARFSGILQSVVEPAS